MATNDNSAALQMKSGKYLLDVFDKTLGLGDDLLDALISKGIIDLGRLNEVLDAELLGLELDSTYGKDLSDGSDCKFATVTYSETNNRWSASASTKNCVGDVRVRIYHPEEDLWWYGVIPHECVKDLQGLYVGYDTQEQKLTGKYSVFFREGWEPFETYSQESLEEFCAPTLYVAGLYPQYGRNSLRCSVNLYNSGCDRVVRIKCPRTNRVWEGSLSTEDFSGKKFKNISLNKKGEIGGWAKKKFVELK